MASALDQRRFLFPIVDYLKDWLKMLRTTQERRRRTTCDSLQMPITSQTRKLVSAGPREVHLKEIPPEIKGNLLIKQTNNKANKLFPHILIFKI